MLLYLLCFLSISLIKGEDNPMVNVAHGKLKGSWQQSYKGRTYASFRGIPYAQPPIGNNRFKDPQPLESWTGVKDATKYLSPCLQYDNFPQVIRGHEDCLHLNVFTPNLNTSANLPVFIFIHGGAFMSGYASIYAPDRVMDWDMVTVILQYRLGPLGFLSTGDETASGNFGLKDQAVALRWVKDNIKEFGGDPNSITLTGDSAGGASVHYHYLSPWSQGTFHRGIAYSGSGFSSWTHQTKPLEKARILAGKLQCPTANTAELVSCLKEKPGEAIIKAFSEMYDWKVRLFSFFTPVVEAASVKEPFLSQDPYLASKAGLMTKLPLIASVNSEEGLYPAAAYQVTPSLLPELEAQWEQMAANIFEYNDTLPLELRPAVAKSIKDHYMDGKAIGQDTFPQLVQALGDRHFVADIGVMAQTHAEKSLQPVYVYRFSFRGSSSLSDRLSNSKDNYGTSHGDDVIHIFAPVKGSDDDERVSEELINMIYTYSTTGVPKLTIDGSDWQPVTPGSPELDYLEIRSPNSFQMKKSSDFGQKSFWHNLPFLETQNLRSQH